ncbi:hypothetical protein ANCCAN_07162 [Ancylostoma caninum]|uniref:SCP domain-containing protein n=1 Tax=Ancylostoma caninum TaxID=29170 RepID=A0A368GR51_ANCCA|nr:hypothetical protein ANCCAN_07162 [Ancylostoma caninum]
MPNITNFVNNATTKWRANLTSGSMKKRTEVGCNFYAGYIYTLVCAFA